MTEVMYSANRHENSARHHDHANDDDADKIFKLADAIRILMRRRTTHCTNGQERCEH